MTEAELALARKINEAKEQSRGTVAREVIDALLEQNHRYANRITGLQITLENLVESLRTGDFAEWKKCFELAVDALDAGGDR